MDGAAPNQKKGEALIPRPTFEELFAAHYDWMRHTVMRLGIPEREAEDLTHEVMLTVLRMLPTFDASRPVRPWLMGIAFRVCSTHRRSARVRHEVVEPPVIEPVEDRPDALAQIEAEQRRATILEALAEVDESRRPVLILSDVDGFSMPEIVIELGIPLNTGYSRLRLAREELRSALRRRLKGAAL